MVFFVCLFDFLFVLLGLFSYNTHHELRTRAAFYNGLLRVNFTHILQGYSVGVVVFYPALTTSKHS